ncbi:hypothetical protein EJV47_06325 [Hymenobacter gummosus]|uniref:Uncharacterized protein n=1 Tax=Hymenobacter gummosus TaxID=1776032 RepID=A0A3S0JBN8_9BACT|nr:hypothetical protein [Hymenobacter gummosus]RTQ51416.1 hypothetical protein EJV47_06325 [Hymenobacter gummosus]
MAAPRIDDHLHDAVVEQFCFDAERGRLTLVLWEKPEPLWQTNEVVRKRLVLSGIRNGAAVAAVQQLVEAAWRRTPDRELGYRVDRFDFDPALPSRPLDLHLRLAIDHLPPLRIHCAKFTMQPVE